MPAHVHASTPAACHRLADTRAGRNRRRRPHRSERRSRRAAHNQRMLPPTRAEFGPHSRTRSPLPIPRCSSSRANETLSPPLGGSSSVRCGIRDAERRRTRVLVAESFEVFGNGAALHDMDGIASGAVKQRSGQASRRHAPRVFRKKLDSRFRNSVRKGGAGWLRSVTAYHCRRKPRPPSGRMATLPASTAGATAQRARNPMPVPAPANSTIASVSGTSMTRCASTPAGFSSLVDQRAFLSRRIDQNCFRLQIPGPHLARGRQTVLRET